MKLLLGYAAMAAVGALVLVHHFQEAAPSTPDGAVVVHTTDGPVVERTPSAPAPGDIQRFSSLGGEASTQASRQFRILSDSGEGHAARDAARAAAEPAMDRLLASAPCDGIARQAYLDAVGPYVALRLEQMKAHPVAGYDPRWHTPADARIVSGFDTLLRRGLLSQGDMQRAVLSASLQGRILMMFKPPPRAVEARFACASGT